MTIADSAGLPVAVWIASATPHEVTLVEETLDQSLVKQSPKKLIGDKAYDSDALDARLREGRGIELIVDRWEQHPDHVWIRQRVANVGVNRDERLLRLGFRAAEPTAKGFQFRVTTVVVDENGEQLSGKFDIEVVTIDEKEGDLRALEKLAEG